MPGRVYRFGPFRYDGAQRVLFRGEELVPLVPKALDTLEVLLERRGQVVDKAELMKRVWPDTVVEDIGLTRNISLLRKALGDDAETYIETVPKRGYRFVAESGEADRPSVRSQPRLNRQRWVMIAAGVLGALVLFVYYEFYRPSRFLPQGSDYIGLAVIPFEAPSPDPELAAFAVRATDVLTAELSKLDSVHVISPATVRRYQRLNISPALMARILVLPVIVEGSVQRLGDRSQVNVRLTDVHSGKLIWAEHYDRGGESESDLARAIAGQVRAHLAKR